MNYDIAQLRQAMKNRHSVRQYEPTPIAPELVQQLHQRIDEINAEAGLHLQLVTDEPDAFGRSFFARYGKFRGVRNYICLVGPKAADLEERIGYYGERLVLEAQAAGLRSCWVGLSYNKRHVACPLQKGERLVGLIALGYGSNDGVEHRSKHFKELSSSVEEPRPAWFEMGVVYAMLAPTALNQQKFHLRFVGERKVKLTSSWGPYAKVDKGIARLHFELGAYPKPIDWVK